MKHPPLTAAALRNLKPKEKGYSYFPDGGCPGLRLRASAQGRYTWILSCRDQAGQVRSITLGDYGGVGSLGLAEARERARRERQRLKDGQDIIKERRAARIAYQARESAATLRLLLEQYETHVVIERQKKGEARSWSEAKRAIHSVLARFLDPPLSELTAPMLQHMLDSWPSKARAGATVRFVRPILKWGVRRGHVAPGIAEQLQQPEGANTRRQRVLTEQEISSIWRQLEDSDPYGRAFKWLFWTCCRKSEMTRARWQDLDLERREWTIPAKHSKNGREHVIPLPTQAVEALQERQPVASPDALAFPNRSGGELSNWDRATKRLQSASDTSGWHRHDIRRTSATLLGDLGTPPHIIECVLNHALATSSDGSLISSVARTYNTSRYKQEHAAALQILSDKIDRIIFD